MEIKAILFDLDGTLLPMDNDVFVKAYFKALIGALAKRGYEPSKLTDSVWTCIRAMLANDGTQKNEDAYWNAFSDIYGEGVLAEKQALEEFYNTDFNVVSASCGFNPKSASCVRAVKDMGIRTVLATNPVFPEVATRARMRWAGLSDDDFELVTCYENSSFSKPKLEYYKEILEKIGASPENCLMVGNDVDEDMVAAELGLRVFLTDACLINKSGKDISSYPKGDFAQLLEFIKNINS